MPSDASLESFDWRVSRAHVATDGPFSKFPDVDRTLLVLNGAGLRLAGAPFGAVELTPDSLPFPFDGGADVTATLTDGPIDDLNVMTRSRRARHEVTRRTITETCELLARGDALVVFVQSGEISLGGEAVLAGDAVLSENGMVVLGAASTPGARVVVVNLWTLPSRDDGPPFRTS